MNVNPQAIAAMRAVTISREYGSGGGEIAARLARRLNWQLIDHAIIEQTARELEVHETEVEKHDEEYVEGTRSGIPLKGRFFSWIRLPSQGRAIKTRIVSCGFPGRFSGCHAKKPPLERSGILDRILEQFAPSAPMTGGGGVFIRPSSSTETLAYGATMRDIITAATTTGHVVIVGRGGQVLLADKRDVLHVRIVAPLEQCVAYVVSREGLDTEAARRRVQAKDQARTRYMQTQYRCQHEDPHLYDLVINTAVLSLDSAVDQICLALEGKANRISVPVEQLGPAAGLAPYPGRAADFRGLGQPSS